MDSRLLEAGAESDRAWFAKRTGRSYRVRDPLPDEAPFLPRPAPGARLIIVVKQVRRGARLRVAAEVGRRPLNSEAEAERLYKQASPRLPLLAQLERLLRDARS